MGFVAKMVVTGLKRTAAISSSVLSLALQMGVVVRATAVIDERWMTSCASATGKGSCGRQR